VIANQAGGGNFSPAPTVTRTVNANLAAQTITFTTNAPASAVNLSSFTVAAAASSGLTVAFTSSGACTNVGKTDTVISGAGTCSVIANQAGNGKYLAAPAVSEMVNAALAAQTIAFTTVAPASKVYRGTFIVAAKASSALTVAFTSSGSCTNVGTTFTMTSGTGTCSVIANQAGNRSYTAAPTVTAAVNATPAAQNITFTAPPPNPAGSAFTVAAGARSLLPVTFTLRGFLYQLGRNLHPNQFGPVFGDR
jgi:large repetitive protein